MLKRVKARVAGAEEMQEAEHLLNVLASKAAGDAVAPFLGYAAVDVPVSGLPPSMALGAGTAAAAGAPDGDGGWLPRLLPRCLSTA